MTNTDIDKLIEKARVDIRRKYPTLKEAQNAMYPLFSATQVQRIYSNKESIDSFDKISKDRLIYFHQNGFFLTTYNHIAKEIGQTTENRNVLLDEKIQGDYKYFRFHCESGNCKILKYVIGDITILRKDDIPLFFHTSHNFKGSGPEHQGFVFLNERNLFMLGKRTGTLRLAAATIDLDDPQQPIPGIVLSIRRNVFHDPFSARFLMVSTKNHTLVSELSDQTPLENPTAYNTTKGTDRFFEITRGDYSFYMLANPF